MKPLQPLALLLYLPLLAALSYQTTIALWVLRHGHMAGLYGLLYGAVLVVMGRRAFKIGKNQLEAGAGDLVVAGLADALLLFLALAK